MRAQWTWMQPMNKPEVYDPTSIYIDAYYKFKEHYEAGLLGEINVGLIRLDDIDALLANLCGKENVDPWWFTPEDIELLKLLAGPNSWCIYKAILARRG
jgi:hypothetical protein